jgi:hypothetical protein
VEIKLDNDLLKSVVSEAIVKSLDEEKRNALIQGAIQALLTPQQTSGYYGRKETPVEQAFNEAVRNVAHKVAEEMLAGDERVRARLKELMNAALVKVMDDNREATVTKIADALAAGMAYRGRD